MPIYMKLEGIDGEVTAEGYKKWIEIESFSDSIARSIAAGAKDTQRTRGETSIGDAICVREYDKSSVKLKEACANGTFYKEVLIDFCTTADNKQQPYLKYKLENALVSSYSFHANGSGSPLPTEQVALNFTKAEWTHVNINKDTGKAEGGVVVGKYSPGEGKS